VRCSAKIIFFSDTHLLPEDHRKSQLVEGFIRDICSTADTVFIVGDLFEFFYGHKGYIYPWYKGVVGALKSITGAGTTVYLIEGNHEFNTGSLEELGGIRCAPEVSLDIDGKMAYITHGDGFTGPFMRKILKSRLVYSLMELFGPELTWRIAMSCRVFLSNRNKHANPGVGERFRTYAATKFAEGYDIVILAHSHHPDHIGYDTPEGRKTYLNTGDFVEYGNYVEYTTRDGFSMKHYLSPRH
jgi:UDP-2,3-diacylglucosamine hydrolase